MKKFVSILLAVMLVAAIVTSVSAYSVYPDGKTSEQAVKEYEETNGVTVPTHRYYFQMPNGSNGPLATSDVSYLEINQETGEEKTIVVCHAGEHTPTWYNDYTEGAGVYWWGSAEANPDGWAGYKAMVADAEHSIYYVDMPAKVVSFVWNNGVDGGTDPNEPIYYYAAQTSDIACEYPDPGEFSSIPEGADSFDNMIAVVDPDKVSVNDYSHKMTCGFNWYFYYGDGCYGSYATDSANFTDVATNCANPDHFVDGKHVGFHSDETPTEPGSTEPPVKPDPIIDGTHDRGDADGDGTVGIMDATRIQRYLANLTDEDGIDMIAADADLDGNVGIMDATRIQRVLAGLCDMDGNKVA